MTSTVKRGHPSLYPEVDVMYDSIKLFFYQEFPIKYDPYPANLDLPVWLRHQKLSKGGEVNVSFKYWGNGYPTFTHLEYIPVSWNGGRPLLKVLIGSVQKIKYGNNIQNCADNGELIQSLNSYLWQIDGLGDIDAGEGLIRTIDFCACYRLDANLDPMMEVLRNKRIPRRRHDCYDNAPKLTHKEDGPARGGVINGVTNGNDSIIGSFYMKFAESRDKLAEGILRQEVRLRGKKTIQTYTGLVNPKLKQLTPEIAKKVLNHELNLLGLDRDIPTQKSVHQQLKEKYGAAEGHELFSKWLALKDCPNPNRQGIIAYTGFTPSKVDRLSRQLKAAGLSFDVTSIDATLPKMEPTFNSDVCKNDNEFLCDTRNDNDLGLKDSLPAISDNASLQNNSLRLLRQKYVEPIEKIIAKESGCDIAEDSSRSEDITQTPNPTGPEVLSFRDDGEIAENSKSSPDLFQASSILPFSIKELEKDPLSQEDKPVLNTTWSIDLNISFILKQLFEFENESEVVSTDLRAVDTFFPILDETDLPMELLSVFGVDHPVVAQALGKEVNTGPPLT